MFVLAVLGRFICVTHFYNDAVRCVLATNFRLLFKTNKTGVLESLIYVTKSAEAFLQEAIIIYKYQIGRHFK